MLVKELKELESINIISRQTFNTVPITVENSFTEQGLTLKPVIDQIMQWSDNLREALPKAAGNFPPGGKPGT